MDIKWFRRTSFWSLYILVEYALTLLRFAHDFLIFLTIIISRFFIVHFLKLQQKLFFSPMVKCSSGDMHYTILNMRNVFKLITYQVLYHQK